MNIDVIELFCKGNLVECPGAITYKDDIYETYRNMFSGLSHDIADKRIFFKIIKNEYNVKEIKFHGKRALSNLALLSDAYDIPLQRSVAQKVREIQKSYFPDGITRENEVKFYQKVLLDSSLTSPSDSSPRLTKDEKKIFKMFCKADF